MARIAVFTDVHAILPALRAVLAAVDELGCEAVYHTGDAVGIGPFPAECLDVLLRRPNTHMTMGNHDAVLVRGPGSSPAEGIDQEEHAHQRWLCRVVPPRLRRRVARWPYALRRTIGGVRMLFVHYGLTASGDDFDSFVPEPRPSDLDALFAGCAADVVFYGHDHGASDLVGAARYVNPGSAGCHTVPLARYVVVDAEKGAYSVEHRAVPYEDSSLWPAFRERGVPAADFIHRAFFGGRWAGDPKPAASPHNG